MQWRTRNGAAQRRLTIFGAWRPSTNQSTFAAETEIYDQNGDLVAIGVLIFLDQKAAD